MIQEELDEIAKRLDEIGRLLRLHAKTLKLKLSKKYDLKKRTKKS